MKYLEIGNFLGSDGDKRDDHQRFLASLEDTFEHEYLGYE
jgi:hypothetical protein